MTTETIGPSDTDLDEYIVSGQWRCTPEELQTAITRLLTAKRKLLLKLDYARERFDDIENALQSWRARDGQMRQGDPPATSAGESVATMTSEDE